ncbi:Protein SON [Eumeta japonica]|uniref:Protein SON n=1 Tax=Eumeta variegata TaxID=151549 RepID=A0A4C1TZ31_EUMVA|nr:Protein SON [Eumeta japonica]
MAFHQLLIPKSQAALLSLGPDTAICVYREKNIKMKFPQGGAPLPVKAAPLAIVDKDELRMQFPVSSGTQHREKASEWVPVSPPQKDMQVAKIENKPPPKSTPKEEKKRDKPIPALPAPPPKEPPAFVRSSSAEAHRLLVEVYNEAVLSESTCREWFQKFKNGEFDVGDKDHSGRPKIFEKQDLSSLPALPAPGPQAYPPGIQPPPDIGSIVTEKLMAIRREQEELESTTHGFGWKSHDPTLGQFMGSTGAQILTPKQLASGAQAWAKKDQLVRAAPVEGGMGMHLLQKMGWTPGQGLGKEGTGTLQPLLLEVKLDTRGLQAKEEGRQMRSHRGQGRRSGGGGALVAGGKHPVSLLGEYCSKQKLGPPEYSLCFECGPDHKKTFLFRVKVAGVEYQPAVASANKKQAKADAAQLALQKLGILP